MRYVVLIALVLFAVPVVALLASEPASSEIAKAYAKIRPSVVEVQIVASDGVHLRSMPGVVVGPETRVVSPLAESDSGSAFRIVGESSGPLQAKVLRSGKDVGCVVLLSYFEKPLPSVSFAEGHDVAVGDSAVVIDWGRGSPEPTCSRVLISQIEREEDGRDMAFHLDSAIGPGVSAGILINLDGHPIGVVQSGGKRAVAVPADRVAEYLARIPSAENAEPGVGADSR